MKRVSSLTANAYMHWSFSLSSKLSLSFSKSTFRKFLISLFLHCAAIMSLHHSKQHSRDTDLIMILFFISVLNNLVSITFFLLKVFVISFLALISPWLPPSSVSFFFITCRWSWSFIPSHFAIISLSLLSLHYSVTPLLLTRIISTESNTGDRRHPWRHSRPILHGSGSPPFSLTNASWFMYKVLINRLSVQSISNFCHGVKLFCHVHSVQSLFKVNKTDIV